MASLPVGQTSCSASMDRLRQEDGVTRSGIRKLARSMKPYFVIREVCDCGPCLPANSS